MYLLENIALLVETGQVRVNIHILPTVCPYKLRLQLGTLKKLCLPLDPGVKFQVHFDIRLKSVLPVSHTVKLGGRSGLKVQCDCLLSEWNHKQYFSISKCVLPYNINIPKHRRRFSLTTKITRVSMQCCTKEICRVASPDPIHAFCRSMMDTAHVATGGTPVQNRWPVS